MNTSSSQSEYTTVGDTSFIHMTLRLKIKSIPAFFGLVKDNHIYTLNSNIVSLARKKNQMNFSCNASSNFIFNRNEKPVKYKVFNTIDDILPILRECQKNKDEELEFNLIHSESI